MYLNDRIEHTLLNPKAKRVDIQYLCLEAKKHKFRSVCVNPEWVGECRRLLRDTDIKIVQVYGFPTSKSTLLKGDEIDVLIKLIGISKSRKRKKLGYAVIEQVINNMETVGIDRSKIKVVIETRVMAPKDIIVASKILTKLKVGYIKSSTGLFNRVDKRTNLYDLKLIKRGTKLLGFISRKLFGLYVPKIKMAGGISNRQDAEELIKNGAYIIGCSKSLQVIKPEPPKGRILREGL